MVLLYVYPVNSGGGDDLLSYINANYIKSRVVERAYIAASAPTDVTVNDWWKMIWDENVPIIVMLTKLVEQGRCNSYTPEYIYIHTRPWQPSCTCLGTRWWDAGPPHDHRPLEIAPCWCYAGVVLVLCWCYADVLNPTTLRCRQDQMQAVLAGENEQVGNKRWKAVRGGACCMAQVRNAQGV